MNATATETRRPERRMSMEPGEDRVLALSLAYLKAGLAPEDALLSALADYECGYTEDDTCRP